ncbi:unnamed protein product [Paramecium pentaurelia]|uniref:Phosphatidic acid phosphatase type 2/haloperoxidase domain-containing protein n=1 Tax=Paramecium pentaurelia TaxID=43138 RepID=A0A8S1VT53_9CILI|nr:unnamed protein product [Paramecium pentaurelia]
MLLGGLQFMLSSKKIESILYIFLCMFGFTSNGLLKNAYHQPRPYWVEDEIEGIGCNMEFGKPSGHAQTSVIIYYSYLFIFYPSTFIFNKVKVSDNQEKSNKDEPQNKKGLVIFLNILAFLCIIMTGLSRVFLGVHTIGQVSLGWIYGLYIVHQKSIANEHGRQCEILKNVCFNFSYVHCCNFDGYYIIGIEQKSVQLK